jgi:DNA (cytosine-5)-methyltransferase 1
MREHFTAGEMFCGIGGIGKALQQHGVEVLWAVDKNANAAATYNLNLPNVAMMADVRKIDLQQRDLLVNMTEHVDILAAGFPCQPFSVAGHKKGLDDEKNGDMFDEIVRFVKELKPDCLLLENVPTIVTLDNGKSWAYVTSQLCNLGYKFYAHILDAHKHAGLPQHRTRLFVAAFRDQASYEYYGKYHAENVEKECLVEARQKINDVLEYDVPEEYYLRTDHPKYEICSKTITEEGFSYRCSTSIPRKKEGNVFGTLLKSMKGYILNRPMLLRNKRISSITLTEALKAQGFPQDWKFPQSCSTSMKLGMIGDSVAIPCAAKVVEAIVKTLQMNQKEQKPVKTCITHCFDVKDNWLAKRRMGIGGSDAAAILGFSPYKSNVDVYLEKVNHMPEPKNKEHMTYGIKAEKHIAALWKLDYPNYEEVERGGGCEYMIEENPEYPFILGTYDIKVKHKQNGHLGVVEIKTSNPSIDQIPMHYYLQCLHYLLVNPEHEVVFIRVYNRNRYVFYDHLYWRQNCEKELENLLHQYKKFWECVQNKKQPELHIAI